MKRKPKQNSRSHGSRLKLNLKKLKGPKAVDLFEATIEGKFAALNLLGENIANPTENIHGALVDTASEVLGKARKKEKPCMTNDILDLRDRRSLKKRRQGGPLAIQNYSQVNQAIRRKMKQTKENWISDRCQEIDCGIRTENSKTAFNTLKLLTQQQQTKTNLI